MSGRLSTILRFAAGRRRVLVALALAALAAGIAAATAAIGGAEASNSTGTTEVVGGTASEQTLLRTILDGMQPSVIEKVEITSSGNDVALHFTASPDRWNRAIWQESLIAGAFRDRANTSGNNITVLIYGGDSNGAIPPLGRSLPSAAPGDAAAAKQLFQDAATKAGVSLADLTIYQPDGIAVSATLQSNDPASFLLHEMPRFLDALGTRLGSLDGTYISLVDGNDQTVWENSGNTRISEGSVGSRPDLAGCSPVSNWGPTPPPCPAK